MLELLILEVLAMQDKRSDPERDRKERELRQENRKRSAANPTGGQYMDPKQNRDEQGERENPAKPASGAPGTKSGGPP